MRVSNYDVALAEETPLDGVQWRWAITTQVLGKDAHDARAASGGNSLFRKPPAPPNWPN